MKKQLLCGILAVSLAAALLAGCKKENSKDDDKKDGKKTFTVGFDAEYPPYGYMDDNGDYTGFDLELAEEVCKLKGWSLKKQPIIWDNKDNELNSGSVDCLWNGFTMTKRESKYTWSDPYVDNSQVIVAKTDSGIKELKDLADKTVGVQAASAALDVLQDKEEGQKELADTFKAIQEFADYNTAFAELQAGSVDAIAIDIGVAQYQLNSRGNDKFVILNQHLNAEKYAVGFKKGNTELCKEVNEALHTLKKNGTFDKLAEKYDLADMVCLEE